MSSEDTQSGSSAGEKSNSLASRRARLRGSLRAANVQPAQEAPETAPREPKVSDAVPPVPESPAPVEGSPDNVNYGKYRKGSVSEDSSSGSVLSEPAMELLHNIDQAMNACAANLASMQKIASEQTRVLQALSETLANQTLNEIGINLGTLTDSLSAALEPMKAVGDLVPALDQLVASLGAEEAPKRAGPTPDELISNLVDQLANGALDPWTFKCAYMAIFPADHPADLLRRLVELLGTQRLSGDLFRQAYEAIQAAEPPPGALKTSTASSEKGSILAAQNEEARLQLEALRAANEELSRSLKEREKEFEQMMASKDSELQETQKLLNARYEEFNAKYAAVTQALNQREQEYRALLDNKDMELSEKETELGLLRAQMEELGQQTREMVKDLQEQLGDVRTAKEKSARKAAGSDFFDPAPAVAQQRESAASSQPSQPAPQLAPNMVQQGQPSFSGNAPAGSYGAGLGRHGSGVRAQVFEVIVRQALAGAPWREICAGPMQVNNITAEEVEAEVKRRQELLNK